MGYLPDPIIGPEHQPDLIQSIASPSQLQRRLQQTWFEDGNMFIMVASDYYLLALKSFFHRKSDIFAGILKVLFRWQPWGSLALGTFCPPCCVGCECFALVTLVLLVDFTTRIVAFLAVFSVFFFALRFLLFLAGCVVTGSVSKGKLWAFIMSFCCFTNAAPASCAAAAACWVSSWQFLSCSSFLLLPSLFFRSSATNCRSCC